jgi:hypothetical protein
LKTNSMARPTNDEFGNLVEIHAVFVRFLW